MIFNAVGGLLPEPDRWYSRALYKAFPDLKKVRAAFEAGGSFEDGKFVKGQYVDHANRTFIGHFTSNNKLNGTGLIQFQDGFVVNGTFINNKLQVEKYDDIVLG